MISRQNAPQDIQLFLNNLQEEVREKFPESTPEQTAWDLLTRLEENLKAYETAKIEAAKCELFEGRASTLSEQFQAARDHILGELYGEIRDRFKGLYRKLHEEDENNFDATLTPDGARSTSKSISTAAGNILRTRCTAKAIRIAWGYAFTWLWRNV